MIVHLLGLIAEQAADISALRAMVEPVQRPPSGWLSLKQVAALTGTSVEAVRGRCIRGTLIARRIGPQWWVAPAAAQPGGVVSTTYHQGRRSA